jgi:DNA-binding transcriptional LysR family regulator
LPYVLPGLLEGRLDFAVALASPSDLPQEIVFEPLVQAHAVPTGRLGHPLAHARSWDELKDASWVLNLTDGSLGNHLLRWLASQGIEAPKNIVRCSSLTLMLELMRRTDYLRLRADSTAQRLAVCGGAAAVRSRPGSRADDAGDSQPAWRSAG